MPLHIGGSEVDKVMIGSEEAETGYLGADELWASGEIVEQIYQSVTGAASSAPTYSVNFAGLNGRALLIATGTDSGSTSDINGTGCSVGGIAGTLVVQSGGSARQCQSVWLVQGVPDSVQTVTATYTRACRNGRILIVALDQSKLASLTPFDTWGNKHEGNSVWGDIDVPANGIAIGLSWSNGTLTSNDSGQWTVGLDNIPTGNTTADNGQTIFGVREFTNAVASNPLSVEFNTTVAPRSGTGVISYTKA